MGFDAIEASRNYRSVCVRHRRHGYELHMPIGITLESIKNSRFPFTVADFEIHEICYF